LLLPQYSFIQSVSSHTSDIYIYTFAGDQPPKAFCFPAVRVPSVCDRALKVCEHDILQTACENFTKFTTKVQLETMMNWLDFKVKRSEVKE